MHERRSKPMSKLLPDPLWSSCTPSAKLIIFSSDADRFLEVYDTAGIVMVPSPPVATGGGGGIGLVARAISASILLTMGGTAAGMGRFGAGACSTAIFFMYLRPTKATHAHTRTHTRNLADQHNASKGPMQITRWVIILQSRNCVGAWMGYQSQSISQKKGKKD